MEPLTELLGDSPPMAALRAKARQLLQHGHVRLPPILIQGETGAGKGLLARALQAGSSRANRPFVEINCAALPATLLEAEMFGFERGAFTDARQAKPGLFQTAHTGTIFLDEIGLLPALQAKFLKVVEDKKVRRLGATRDEVADVWILAASNENLLAAVREGKFREDLYHRLSVVSLEVPPLRQRGDDIVILAERFLARACADYGRPVAQLDAAARAAAPRLRVAGQCAGAQQRRGAGGAPVGSASHHRGPARTSREPRASLAAGGHAVDTGRDAQSPDVDARAHRMEYLGHRPPPAHFPQYRAGPDDEIRPARRSQRAVPSAMCHRKLSPRPTRWPAAAPPEAEAGPAARSVSPRAIRSG